ncbi:ABC transporter permease [Chitinophaga barathri]|uniref:ABC transporter permease n=1 Tax=Chitinophaga barathri TaxID=1647451 RepID=A0A3N4M6X5_9BACT|nr:ABC transporter permease [Chitinophaga barathri]RPD39184.1 ABC transporter permease [Chitinophaga barathri]
MNKIWIIIKREYLTRVKKKSFIVTTLLLPLLFVAMLVVPVLIMSGGDSEKVAVVDESQFFEGKLADEGETHYKFVQANIDTLKNTYTKLGYTGVLHIPKMDINRPPSIIYYSKGQMNIILKSNMEKKVEAAIEDKRMELAGIDKAKLEGIRVNVDIVNLAGKEEKKGSAGLAYGIGYGAGFLIYIILLVFGTVVMRGVMEEKMNRIAEVMISSVKPFQLMMGKIIGIAFVGLTQFLIWIVLIVGLYTLLIMLFGPEATDAAMKSNAMANSGNNAAAEEAVKQMMGVMEGVNWTFIIFCFLFYFLGGYLFYAALFAAVGSLVNEDPNDAQSLTFPVTIPVIFSIFIMIASVRNPNSSLAVWGSMIPFSSPIVMMARIPYGVPGTVPYWQLGLSMALLIAGFIGTTWVAAKIYRTGILLYGKKVTLKEVAKWVVRKN